MRKTKLLLIFLLSVFLLPIPFRQAQAAKSTWTVVVGGQMKDSAIASNFFHPREIDIAVGDTVAWKFEATHTVTFLGGRPRPAIRLREGDKFYRNPDVFFRGGGDTYDGTAYLNSGTPPDPKFTYSLTFTKAGTYEYMCLLHLPAMSGTVNVRERAFNSPAATERRGRSELAATLKAGEAAWATWEPERRGQTVILPMIDDPKAGFSILRFTKDPLVISPGTTVSWVNRDSSRPHTATLLGGEPPPAEVIVEAQAQGPSKLLINPKWLNPSKITTYEGGFATSGQLFPTSAPPDTPKNFSLTFAKPGQYEYVCMFHEQVGMKGTIIVR